MVHLEFSLKNRSIGSLHSPHPHGLNAVRAHTKASHTTGVGLHRFVAHVAAFRCDAMGLVGLFIFRPFGAGMRPGELMQNKENQSYPVVSFSISKHCRAQRAKRISGWICPGGSCY